MIAAQETFGGTRPFKPGFFDGNGFRMHYFNEGNGALVVCMASPPLRDLYRHFIPPLSVRITESQKNRQK